MTRCTAILLALAVGCKRDPGPAKATASPAAESRGFGRAKSVPDALTPAQQAKLERFAKETQEPAVVLPAEMQGRRVPTADGAAALDVYVDGKLGTTVTAATLERTVALADLMIGHVRARARNVLVHGETRDLWVSAADATHYRLRVNRRGGIKLEPATTTTANPRGPGSGTGPATDGTPKRVLRSLEVRNVAWIEFRTDKAPLLVGEPVTGSPVGGVDSAAPGKTGSVGGPTGGADQGGGTGRGGGTGKGGGQGGGGGQGRGAAARDDDG